MTRRIAKTKEQRLAMPRTVSTPERGVIGTIQALDSGFWAYVRKNGTQGLANTARQARLKLEAA